MTTPVPFLFVPTFRALDSAGNPLAAGLLYTYAANSLTPQTTWSDALGTVPNTNPIVLDTTGSATVRLSNLAYKFVLKDAGGATQWTQDFYQNSYLAQTDIVTLLGADPIQRQTAAEIAAGVTPVNFAYAPAPYDIRREGALVNDSTDDTAALNATILVAAQTVNGAIGAAVSVPTGISILLSEITLPNKVRVVGQNKRGSYFQAKSTWNSGTSPWMFHANNGTSAMFDSTLEYVSVDTNSIAGLGCILSDAWQEGCGLRNVLLINFTTSGVKFQNGYGGAALSKIVDAEIFGLIGSTGIDLSTPMGAAAAFMLDVSNTTIAGGVSGNMAAGISCKGNSLLCRSVHFEVVTSAIIVDGVGYVSLDDLTGAGTVTNLVTIASTFTGTLVMRNCRRNGATNFLNDLRAGGYGTIGAYDIPFLIINPGDVTNAAKGLPFASAWATWNGTTTGTNAPINGYNVTSVTRNSAGNYSINFSRPLLNANAAVSASSNLTTNGSQIATQLASTGSVTVLTAIAGTPTDSNEVKVMVFGG